MRRRLLEVVATFVGTFSVAEGFGCELDETYFPESFKGNCRGVPSSFRGERTIAADSAASAASPRSKSASCLA